MALDVTDADFEQRVLQRSAELPVLVDFWADWCQPCHMLAPVIERAVAAHPGKVELAKLDVDSNQVTAAQPPQVVARFVDSLVPSEADELIAAGDEQALRRALELEPGHAVARR